jgi:hypothetical protein
LKKSISRQNTDPQANYLMFHQRHDLIQIKYQLKFRKNKNYSSIIVIFHTGICYKDHIILQLKLRKGKTYQEKRTSHSYAVTFVLLEPLKWHLTDVTSFRVMKLFILDLFCTNTLIPSYVYWTMHHLDSWIKIDQLDVTCFIISLFTAQHVSNVSVSIFRSLW